MTTQPNESPFSASVKDGGLTCEVTVCAGFDQLDSGAELCLSMLRDQGIRITAAVEKSVAELVVLHGAEAGVAHTLVVAKGEAPVHAKDGRLEILPRFDADMGLGNAPSEIETADEVLGPGEGSAAVCVDHHERSVFVVVEIGERIGTLHPPMPGVDGASVTGESIAAKLGKTVALNTDESVLVRDNGAIESAMSGVVRIEGRKIRILQKLDIHGSVDFSTGNLDFSGDVEVNKGVKDGFRVLARRDVIVRGLVEAATIRAGRDLHLLGGAACREKGTLCAERDIVARYLNECELEAGRNLTVEKEIISAHVAVGGDLIAPNCTIIGGTILVTGACDAAEIGSARNIPTLVTLGKQRDADLLDDRVRTLLGKIEGRLRKSQSTHDQLNQNIAWLTPTQTESMNKLQTEIRNYERLEGALTDAVSGMHRVVAGVARAELTVQKLLWQGVTILIDDWEAGIKESLKGPLRISCEPNRKPILTDLISGSSVELSTVARVRSRIEDQGADEAMAA